MTQQLARTIVDALLSDCGTTSGSPDSARTCRIPTQYLRISEMVRDVKSLLFTISETAYSVLCKVGPAEFEAEVFDEVVQYYTEILAIFGLRPEDETTNRLGKILDPWVLSIVPDRATEES